MERTNGRKGRPKVKSGCRTCKVRKVKCDEGRPACQRCVSTGRYCDGYGVWGGGSKALVVQSGTKDIPMALAPGLASSLDGEEKQYFDWFRHKTAVKLPASYMSNFWKSLLLQAGADEPAVLHACLALSSVQKRETVFFGARSGSDSVLDTQEQFAIRHYVKAIGHLSPKLAVRDKALHRVTLIACAVFISFELLRGHFEAANTHYANGLKAMEQMHMLERIDDSIYYSRASSELIEDHIFETFARYHFQKELFKYFGPGPNLPLTVLDDFPHQFRTIKPAWRDLQQIMNDILRLTNRGRRQERRQATTGYPGAVEHEFLLGEQQRIRADLIEWLANYDELTSEGPSNGTTPGTPSSSSASSSPPISTLTSRSTSSSSSSSTSSKALPTKDIPIAPSVTKIGPSCDTPEDTTEAGIGLRLVRVYHTLALIMLETALTTGDAMSYDAQTPLFQHMMTQMIRMWASAVPPATTTKHRGLPRNRIRMSSSTTDVGCIAPLFFVAIKCRVYRLRMHAVRFLDICGHREGLWDAKTVALAARRVVEIEGGGRGWGKPGYGEWMLVIPSEEEVAGAKVVPLERRVDEVQVWMLGAPMERIGLRCVQRRGGLARTVVKEEYDILRERWEACLQDE